MGFISPFSRVARKQSYSPWESETKSRRICASERLFFVLSDGNKCPLAAWTGWMGEFMAGPRRQQASRSPFCWVKRKAWKFLTRNWINLGLTSAMPLQGAPRRLPGDGDPGLQLQNATLGWLEAAELLLGRAGEVGNGGRHLRFALHLDI